MTWLYNGNVGIGTTTPDTKLAVNGTIHSKEVKVDLSVPAPDYVFNNNYPLTNLTELQDYITKNKHLPEIPSAMEMQESGMNLGEMNLKLLKKVEELTLYMIDKDQQLNVQQSKIIEQENKLTAQQEQINQMKQQLEMIEKQLNKPKS